MALQILRTGPIRHLEIALIVALITSSTAVVADNAAHTRPIIIQAQPLDTALLDLADAAGVQILFPGDATRGLMTKGIAGVNGIDDALELLLHDTGLEFVHIYDVVIVRPVVTRQTSVATVEPIPPPSRPETRSHTVVTEEIVVTGTRMLLGATDTSKQVITLSRNNIESTGEPTLDRVLVRLPQSFGGSTAITQTLLQAPSELPGGPVLPNGARDMSGGTTLNLRGISTAGRTEGTLILVDGKRLGESGLQGGVQDILSIPFNMVERVEVMLDGASAVYGSDAIGGVVNVVYRKDIDGIEAEIRNGNSTSGGASETSASIAGGYSWATGRVTAGLSSSVQAEQSGADLGFVGFGSFGPGIAYDHSTGMPQERFEFQQTSPPSISLGDAEDRNYLRQNGGGNRPTINNFLPGIGERDYADTISVLPKIEQANATLYVEQELATNFGLRASSRFMRRDTDYNLGFGRVDNALAALDPLNPFAEEILVSAYYPSYGQATTRTTIDSRAVTLEVDFALPERWLLTVGAYFDEVVQTSVGANQWDTRSASQASSPFNPWGDGSDNDFPWSWTGSDGTLQTGTYRDFLYRQGSSRARSRNESIAFDVVMHGEWFDLAGGPVKALLGGEYRDYGLFLESFEPDSGSPTSLLVSFNPMDAGRRQIAGFAEVFTPLVSTKNSKNGVRELAVQLAARTERTTITGGALYDVAIDRIADDVRLDTNASGRQFSAETFSVGFVYSPADRFRLRANYNTSFSVPPLFDLFRPILVRDIQNVAGRDICAILSTALGQPYSCPIPLVFGDVSTPVAEWFQDSPYLSLSGGNPDLKPQTAKSRSITLEFEPMDGLSLSVNWHELRYEDKITTLAGPMSEIGAASYEAIPDAFEYWPNGDVKLVKGNAVNFESDTTEGFDYQLKYASSSLAIDLLWSVETRREENFGQKTGLPSSWLLGIRVPENRGSARIYWSQGDWSFAMDSMYSGELRDRLFYERDRSGYISSPSVFTNIQGSYRFPQNDGLLANVVISMGLNNVFDERIRTEFYQDGILVGPTNATVLAANPRPQSVYFSLRKSFLQ